MPRKVMPHTQHYLYHWPVGPPPDTATLRLFFAAQQFLHSSRYLAVSPWMLQQLEPAPSAVCSVSRVVRAAAVTIVAH